MAYSTSMQIFIDMRGKAPLTEREQEEINLILGSLDRAGFALDEANASPLIAICAWVWARVVGRADVIAGLRETVESTVQPHIAALAEQIATSLRKHEEIDLALKAAPGEIVAQVDHLLGERMAHIESKLLSVFQSPGAPPATGGSASRLGLLGEVLDGIVPAASERSPAPASHTDVFKAGRVAGSADWKAYFLTAAVGVLIGVLLIGAWKLGQRDGAAESRKAIALAQQLSTQCGPAGGVRHARR